MSGVPSKFQKLVITKKPPLTAGDDLRSQGGILVTNVGFDKDACRNALSPDQSVGFNQGRFVGNADDDKVGMLDFGHMKVVTGLVGSMCSLNEDLLIRQVRANQDVAIWFCCNRTV